MITPGIYEHYKGKRYRVIGVGHHSETLEELVFYECLYENELGPLWARPLKMFEEEIEVDGEKRSRFKRISDG